MCPRLRIGTFIAQFCKLTIPQISRDADPCLSLFLPTLHIFHTLSGQTERTLKLNTLPRSEIVSTTHRFVTLIRVDKGFSVSSPRSQGNVRHDMISDFEKCLRNPDIFYSSIHTIPQPRSGRQRPA
ncbi:hypothetical protein HN011_009449 [Eciton burchellii]|nr:hypothetical protein HN011_009449 [Eciton burchellii]